MNPTIQHGMHPDAEVLTAFAERSLSDTERNDVLAHMATCGRCREVVFLAQSSMEAEEPAPSVTTVPERKSSGGWLTGWRWSWIPVAALAGVVGFAVIRHVDRATDSETRMAQNLSPSEMVQSTPTTNTAATQPPGPRPSPPSRAESKEKPAAHERLDRDAELDRKSLDERDRFVAQKKDELAKETLSAAALKDSGGSVHGTLRARAKSSNVGGPMAQNQVQQQNNVQLQQNYANEDRQVSASPDSANKPVSSPIRSGAASETVTVETADKAIPVSPAPSAAPAMTAMQTESADISGRNFEKRKAGNPVLPSKLAVSSEATSGKRIVAIDTAGSLFCSEDAGKHWAPVKAQWSGRAVLVKTGPSMGAVGGLLTQTIARFELTTDKQETWVSDDGKTWTLKAEAGK